MSHQVVREHDGLRSLHVRVTRQVRALGGRFVSATQQGLLESDHPFRHRGNLATTPESQSGH